ncbi:MAG: hypothetical protein E7201_01525 [Selenomonas ruminantium]|uniref:Beta-barrel porin-2, OmpL-like. bbp2 n=1 Tax=Selenomonas ruminantium TaxID=971 RepID=A0A927ZRY2_SELRU|nr:hypothetical protein [Selenomonas ruminantium]
MKKSVKLSIAMALMMGATAGINTVAPSTASAEISDKFRMEVNGVVGYVYNKDYLGGYAKNDANGNNLSSGYWNSYNRLVLNYFADKNVTLHTRLHSGYDTLGNYYANENTSGAYFDQSYIDIKDPKANVTYTVGKFGAVLGQTMIYNSTGNHTGAKISLGNWYDPQSLQLWYVNKKSGQKMIAVQATKELFKNFQMTATYLKHTSSNAKLDTNYYTTTEGKKVTTKKEYRNTNQYTDIEDWDVGFKYKLPGVTIVGEYAQNIGSSERVYAKARSTDKRAFFVEVYTGPTSDMTSGLPLQKPGTNVWSLKYQDIGANAVGSHNTTFYDDARGWRLNYGHTFKKGLAGDIAIARMQDKGGNASSDPANGKWKTAVVAELSYKFR